MTLKFRIKFILRLLDDLIRALITLHHLKSIFLYFSTIINNGYQQIIFFLHFYS